MSDVGVKKEWFEGKIIGIICSRLKRQLIAEGYCKGGKIKWQKNQYFPGNQKILSIRLCCRTSPGGLYNGLTYKRIFNSAKEYGLIEPKVQEFDDMFRVELFRLNQETNQKQDKNIQVVEQVSELFNEKEKELLTLIQNKPTITQHELAESLGWTISNVKYYMTKLKAKKILKRVGSNQKGNWKILLK